MGTTVTMTAADGSGTYTGYLATPEGGKGPGVVVLQEIFGVNDVMRGICDWLAGEGFTALCPDLFWRIEPNIEITDKTDAEWARAFELFQAFDVDKGMEDAGTAVDFLRLHHASTGKVGSIGYCLGGRLAYLAATRTSVDASVGYYGVMLTEHLNEVFKAPLMLHIATQDEYAPAEAQKAIHEALDDNGKVTLFDYEGREHAFAREGGAHYHDFDAKLANGRSLNFLHSHLG
ncbi:MAG: dienelactone hydrolase family protein [Magnetovibrionaceae bacterium]